MNIEIVEKILHSNYYYLFNNKKFLSKLDNSFKINFKNDHVEIIKILTDFSFYLYVYENKIESMLYNKKEILNGDKVWSLKLEISNENKSFSDFLEDSLSLFQKIIDNSEK